MKQNEPINKIMSTELKTIHVAQKLSDARKLIAESGIEHVPVVSGEKLVGMISSADLMRLTFDAGNADVRSVDAVLDNLYTVEGVMTTKLKTLKSTDTVRRAAELLVDSNYHSLPVLSEDKLVGIVTSTDLIRYLLDQY